MQTLIPNPKNLKTTESQIFSEGAKKLHIIADFDGTLTKTRSQNGEKIPSLIAILRHENYLSEKYSKEAQKLFEHYYPIENDPDINISEKKEKMTERRTKHFQLLINEKLQQSDLEKITESNAIQLRDGVVDFFKLTKEKNIPLIILSANGIGTDSIKIFLEKQKLNFPNIHIVSNELIRNENGTAIDYKKPVVHSFNKDETVLQNFKFYSKIQNRKNIILLGNNLGDHHMADGCDYKNIIKIGFLDSEDPKLQKEFENRYDIIFQNNGDYSYPNGVLQKL